MNQLAPATQALHSDFFFNSTASSQPSERSEIVELGADDVRQRLNPAEMQAESR